LDDTESKGRKAAKVLSTVASAAMSATAAFSAM